MRALVVYFSITGTTERVAEAVADGLRESGCEATLHDLRDGPVPGTAGYDIVGVGFPVHWFRMPVNVSAAFRALGDLSGRSGFVFALCGTYRGAGLNLARAALRKTGAREIGVFACHGEGRFHGYSIVGHQFSTGHPDTDDLAAARAFGAGLPAAHGAASAGKPIARVAPDPHTHWVHAVERAFVAPWISRLFLQRFIGVDPSRCVRCGTCSRICPTHNIAWERGELPRWGKDCILCLSCAEFCPESAVRCPITWPVFRPFLLYNVRNAGNDPSLVHRRVELRRGKLVPLEGADRDSHQVPS